MKARIPGEMDRGSMMKRIQQMQEDIERVQAEVEATSYSASISISPDVVDPDDVEMLQDMVIVAVNEAIRKATEAMEKGIEAAKGGLSIPGLM